MSSKQQYDFDVIILGGGLVGATLALALLQQGKKVLLLEKKPPKTNLGSLSQAWDARIYAVSPTNQQFLNKLGVWPEERVQAVNRMQVYGDGHGHISFDAASVNVPCLNYMLENRYLLAKIWLALAENGVTIAESRAQSVKTDVWSAQITLENGKSYRSQLLVGADGANSWLREQVGIEVGAFPYQQQGIVANFSTVKPHHGCAYQWFRGGDILAYLPLPQQQISIVWSTSDAEKLTMLAGEDFARQVAQAGHYTLGELTLTTPVFAFELIKRQPKTVISQRVALIGDAAHTVHPLAGQGVNLGFADVQCLSNLLAQSSDIGSWSLLKQYQRSRLLAVRMMQQGCDGLFRLFANDDLPGIGWLRNQGLNMVDCSGMIKNRLIRQAMGL
ncbi:ubiquinone biosynthesis protein UbiH [Snodgrassella alvi]|uniref:Ubiquinone biosynthesis protein UbiH n=1 Tax=Snodgrassella alvi TaxID=1196083 RepID=A0A2N9WVH3_9NEIS|nr:FAD-dependent oxidoreductase [Snodgrassella alvi]PIT17293.1 ubiquinone biosynthesis protein UbiH [Snodgrassella alvi]